MRTICSAILAATMIVSSAFAATDSAGPLAAGKPAGVKNAQERNVDNTLWWVLGAGVIIGGIALVASGSGNSNGGGVGGGGGSSNSSSGSASNP
jgi:hypothetical protein